MSRVLGQDNGASIRIEYLPVDGLPRLARPRYFVDRIETAHGRTSEKSLHVLTTHGEALTAARTYGLPIVDTTVEGRSNG